MKCLVLCALVLVPVGCLKAPEIVVVDRATALEQQAAGSYDEVEQQLTERVTTPQPVPLTPDQLEALGVMATPLVDHTDETEADRVDALLLQHCVGEGKEGLLVDTYADCMGNSEREAVVAMVDRINHARVQLWRWMQMQQPGTAPEVLRQAWQTLHAEGVVCRGWVQRADGRWEPKQC